MRCCFLAASSRAIEHCAKEGVERFDAGFDGRLGKLSALLPLQLGLDEVVDFRKTRPGVAFCTGTCSVEEGIDGVPEIGIERRCVKETPELYMHRAARPCATQRTARSARMT